VRRMEGKEREGLENGVGEWWMGKGEGGHVTNLTDMPWACNNLRERHDKAPANTHADTYLIGARGSAGRHRGREATLVGGDVHLHGGVAAGVDDLAGVDLLDRLQGWKQRQGIGVSVLDRRHI